MRLPSSALSRSPRRTCSALRRHSLLARALPWLGAIVALGIGPAHVARAASTAYKLTREDSERLLHGKVAKVDQRGAIAISYDFEKGASKEDFIGAASSTSSPLRAEMQGDDVWYKADFEGDISIDMQITTTGRMGAVYLLVNPETHEGYVFLFGYGTSAGMSATAVGKYRKGREPDILYQSQRAALKGGTYALSVSRRGEELQMKLGKLISLKAKDKTYRSGKIGFAGDLTVDRASIQGTLNLRWCEKALSASKDAQKKDDAIQEESRKELFRRLGIEPDHKLKLATPAWSSPAVKETDHYIVVSDLTQAQTDHYARCAEAMHAMYAKVFPVPKETASKAHIYIFRTREGFIRFGAPPWSGGFFLPANGNLYLFDHVKVESTYEVLLHEGFHQYVSLLIKDPPIWFNEGMAQYFETATLKGTQFTFGATNLCLMSLAALAEHGQLCALPDFFRTTHEQFQSPATIGRNYACAWGLAHFFIQYKNGLYRKQLVNYFLALHKGKDPNTALKEAFAGVQWDKVKVQWTAYINDLYTK